MEKIKESIVNVIPESQLSLSCPRVFMFKADLPMEIAIQAQEVLKKQIEEGCLVIPDCMEFIGIEDPLTVIS